MAKMKTHRGSAKRFKRTGTGKLKRGRQNKSHMTGKMSQKRVRQLRKKSLVSKADQKRINDMIPR